MDKEEMTLIINDIILNFKKDIETPLTMFLEKKQFSRYLELSEIKAHLDKTPCFVMEMKGGCLIYFCEEIINNLTKDFSEKKLKLFLEGITLHELFHIWNRLQAKDANSALFSEELVHEELKELYPKQSEVLEEFQKFKNF
jgi:hypothetical protein